MGRHRTPKELADITGASAHNPGRYKDVGPQKSAPIGAPPRYLTKLHKEIWVRLAGEIPWLAREDRQTLENFCRVQARIHGDPECPIAAYAEASKLLSRMGATPVDRHKIAADLNDDREDPLSEFLN